MKKIFLFIMLLTALQAVHAQELQARLTIVTTRISTTVDKKVFGTLQSALLNFINNRKWTGDTYQPFEKIQCNFLLDLRQSLSDNVYKGSLTVQAARPIYNTKYQSPTINFQDDDVAFRYIEFAPIEFNDNRVQGNDPLAANLTAVLAYYIDLILGMDGDSFAPRGGDPYFQKAQNIVNNAPESREISGWKTFDGMRNRYRLIENLTDNRFTLVHDAIYAYYRSGLDQFYDNADEGRAGVLNALNYLSTLNQDNPNSMVMQFFFSGRSNELVQLFSKATPDVKQRARDLLLKLDAANSTAYNTLR
jgi:hypothetical protein